jgi:fido (protein-threonine AMPylation protein)
VTDATRDVTLPGAVLRPRPGHAPLDTDRPYIHGLFLSSTARAYLDNMRPSRARSGLLPRSLTRREIEERLDTMIRRGGEEAASRLRDEARAIADSLGMAKEFAELDSLIGTLLGTRDAKLRAPAAVARKRRRPFDPQRLELFATLQDALRQFPPLARLAPSRSSESSATLAFFEAYFSNFIEGTEFAVKEAADIVFNNVIPADRPDDAHDILGTWRIASNDGEMKTTPRDFDSLVRLLKTRHATIMAGRPDKHPGEFKTADNRAGSTVFVAADLVLGTLEQGFSYYTSLETPFQRAVFMKFLVAEVHPFADGNGRTTRLMMNAELVASAEERIVIPTVFRTNYLSALKALSLNRIPAPLVDVLAFTQKWTAAVNWTSVDETTRELEACNAFIKSDVADHEGKRLLMPFAR